MPTENKVEELALKGEIVWFLSEARRGFLRLYLKKGDADKRVEKVEKFLMGIDSLMKEVLF